MNIFASFKCPIKSAMVLDDKRVVKMILESAQMLSTAARISGFESAKIYKRAYINHPCTKWVAQSSGNYKWLLTHMMTLCVRYTNKTGKTHASEKLIPELTKAIQFLPNADLYGFVNCAANASLGLSFKDEPDVHKAYRRYLIERWKSDHRFPTWNGKEVFYNFLFKPVGEIYGRLLQLTKS